MELTCPFFPKPLEDTVLRAGAVPIADRDF